MTHSSLTSYVAHSPNHYNGRSARICKFTPHHMAGALSVEGCGSVFASSSRQTSSNYGIGGDGRVACYVEEEDAAWTSSNYANDNMAITVEVANTPEGVRNGTWEVSQAAWNSLVALAVDVCRRHGFRLSYDGTPNGSLTEHRMFAATGCPGPYLHDRMPQLAAEVNAILDGKGQKVSNPKQVPGKATNSAGMKYAAHVQDVGWCKQVRDGQVAGTVGYAKRLEALKVMPPKGWTLVVTAHIANVGWKTYKCEGGKATVVGTTGKSQAIEALGVRVAKRPEGDKRKLRFRVHQGGHGWKAWTPEGYASGSDGLGIQLEAAQLVIE